MFFNVPSSVYSLTQSINICVILGNILGFEARAVNKTGKVLPSEAHSVIGGTDVKRMSQCQENATLRGEKGDGGNTAGERCGGERCLREG